MATQQAKDGKLKSNTYAENSIDALPRLGKTTLFWLAFLGPIAIGSTIALAIYRSVNLGSMCFTTECINFFLNTFKAPIAIAGASLPLVALIATLHRSKETAIQITIGLKQYQEALNNNIANNYLKHRDGFYSLAKRFCEEESTPDEKVTIDYSSLYVELYPHNNFSKFDWRTNSKPWQRTKESCQTFQTAIISIDADTSPDLTPMIIALTDCYKSLSLSFESRIWHNYQYQQKHDPTEFFVSGEHAPEGIITISRLVLALVDSLASYTGEKIIIDHALTAGPSFYNALNKQRKNFTTCIEHPKEKNETAV